MTSAQLKLLLGEAREALTDSITLANAQIIPSRGARERWQDLLLKMLKEEETDEPVEMRDMVCPACHKSFKLQWQERPVTLQMYVCDSAGIYGVQIECPYCPHTEELK